MTCARVGAIVLAALDGITPLMAAAYSGEAAIVEELLARGADAAAADRLGKTAMVYAAGQGHAAVVRALLSHGTDVNAVYRNELTALMWAAGFGRDEALRALLEAGARTDLRDNRGKTAAQIAREAGYATMAELLARPR
jgi:ankyrin repeat protein